MREATGRTCIFRCSKGISIPASHAGGDWISFAWLAKIFIFQSPPPMREATMFVYPCFIDVEISIPASHAGGDGIFYKTTNASYYFNPRLPCGRRQWCVCITLYSIYFNPRLPCGRRLLHLGFKVGRSRFQSPPPMREATS